MLIRCGYGNVNSWKPFVAYDWQNVEIEKKRVVITVLSLSFSFALPFSIYIICSLSHCLFKSCIVFFFGHDPFCSFIYGSFNVFSNSIRLSKWKLELTKNGFAQLFGFSKFWNWKETIWRLLRVDVRFDSLKDASNK